jgi:hypothetical protein
MRPSRRNHQVLAIAITLFALWLPAYALASVKTGVKIRWIGDRPLPAQAGHELVGQLEIIAPRPGKLDNLQIGGNGWSLGDSDAPRSLVMSRGERRVVRFRAVPSDPSQPFTVRATFDGVPVERSARLDAASLQKSHLQYQSSSGPTLSGFRAKASPTKAEGTQAQQLSFMGDFKFTRDDGVVLGADHIRIKVWDDDPIVDELMWSGETDANGHFEGAVSWDDCDITGCDDPDIYVEVVASTDACDLQEDSLLEETYTWESPVINDFTGTFIDFGTMWPGTSLDGVVQVFNTITRAHRFAANRGGMNADPVDVQYPDGAANSYYDPDFQELHIIAGHAADEVVGTHEFGHYLHDTFGNLLASDYDNGFCDPPGGPPGHCVWCPEHVGEGWQEGFADWYAQLVVEEYQSDYGQAPYAASHPDGIYGVDYVAACKDHDPDIQFYPDGRTEGYVMAFLRDIQDGVNDDHNADPAPDCYKDALSLGFSQILTVFRDDDPTDIGMFTNSFRARYPQYDMDLWSTAMNVGPTFGFPLPDPAVVSQPVSCAAARTGETYVLHVTGNGSLLGYQWRFNGANLSNGPLVSGATTPTLTLSPLLPTLSGVYDCVVSTCDGSKSITSNQARLAVLDGPEQARPHLTWGENQSAQCGNGTSAFELPPGSYTGLTNVVQVEGGRSYSIALRADGSVYTWGRTTFGELGNGFQVSNVNSPAQINLSNVIQVAAGNTHGLALRRDGTIRSWGYGIYGQLGNGTQADSLRPSNTLFPGCFTAVSGGYYHTLALRSDGTVWACGYGGLGSIGDGGTTVVHTTPTQVPGLTNVIAIRAAGYGSYALKSDGTVWAWGYNVFGEIGDGTTTQRNTPVQVAGLTNIRAITASYYNGYAIRSNGEVYAWGRGDLGGIGNGSFAGQLSPVLIPGLSNPWKIVTGDAGWAMALQYDNTLRAWGYNFDGVLHTGATDGTTQNTHQPVLGIIAANNVGAGYGTAHVMGQISGATAVGPDAGAPPLQLALRVAPTPSRTTASLAFDLPKAGRVSIGVYDIAGRLVRSIVNENRPAGHHVTRWDGLSASGERISSGVFLAKLVANDQVLTRRIILIP